MMGSDDNTQMSNGLVPPQVGAAAAQGAQQGSSQTHAKMLDALSQDYAAAKLKFKKLDEASKLAEHLKKSMDVLTKQGDAVSPDDVIDHASQLVGHGASPQMLAGILADMPSSSGIGLSSWISQEGQQFMQRAQQLEAAKEAARHQLGVTAISKLLGHSIAGGVQGQPQPPQLPPQALGIPTQGSPTTDQNSDDESP